MKPQFDPTLYDRDLQLWCLETITKLKAHNFEQLDIDNLLQEIESLVRRDRREIKSRLGTLLEHLLKRIYIDSAYDNRGWELIINEQRRQLQLLLEESPSLKQYFANVFEDCWQYARSQVIKEYAKAQFPNQWQFNSEVDAILLEEFWH